MKLNNLSNLLRKYNSPLILKNMRKLFIDNKDLPDKRFIMLKGAKKNNSGAYSTQRFYKNITKF